MGMGGVEPLCRVYSICDEVGGLEMGMGGVEPPTP